MIDKIFEEYKNQERRTLINMAKQFGINVKEILSPNVNHDLIVILNSVNLLDREIDSSKIIEEFYEKTMKEGILLGIGFGKTHMIKKIIEIPLIESEILEMELDEYYDIFPKFDEKAYDFEKTCENGMKRLKVSANGNPSDLENEINAVTHITKIIDNNHKELKSILFEEFLDDFNINRKKSKFTLNKKIKIDSENLKPQLRSRFFMEMTGKYKIKKIIEEYFEFLIDMGLDIGIRVGLRLVIEDIQKKVMPFELLKNLSETETMMYIQQEHSDYIYKKQKVKT